MKAYQKLLLTGLLAACAVGISIPAAEQIPFSITAAAAGTVITENLTLTQDTVYDGDLTLEGGTLSLNGYTLIVKGNLYQPNGVLQIGTGTAKISGNYMLSQANGDAGQGELSMFNSGGVLDVDGNVYINTFYADSAYQDSGTLYIGGDLTVYSPNGVGMGFRPYNNHVTEFKGNAVHTVSIANNNYMNIVRQTGNGKILLSGDTSGFTFGSDLTFADGSTISGERNLYLNGYAMTVDGDFTQSGTLTVDVHGSTMNVSGTYVQPNGVLKIGNGTAKISGDYKLSQANGDASLGELSMFSSGGVLDVDGNVYINTFYADSAYQDSGTLRIGGDLTVYSPNGTGMGFRPYSNHVTEFKGNAVHTVNIANNNYMNIVRQTGSGKILLSGDTSGFTFGSDLTFADGSIISGERTLHLNDYAMTVDGDFTQSGTLTVDVHGSTMNVSGTYVQPNGVLKIGNGTAKISSDYKLSQANGDASLGELSMFSSGGVLDVDGNVYINTFYADSSWQDSGTLRIGGDLTVYSPNGVGMGFRPYGNHVTEFKGGKNHIVNLANKNNYLNTIQLGIGDSIEFTGTLSSIDASSGAGIEITPATLASVSGLTVTGTSKGEGQIKFFNNDTSATRTLIVGDTAQIIPTTPTTPTTPEITLLGDVNADGVFNVSDIVLLQKWLLNVSNTKLANWKNGDFTNDNRLDVFDLALMKRELLKQNPPVQRDFSVNISNVASSATGASVYFEISTTGEIPASAWVGVVPAGTAHDEYSADKADIVYIYIKDIDAGYCTLSLPSGSTGNFELRVYANDSGGDELYSKAFTITESTAPTYLVSIGDLSYDADENSIRFALTTYGTLNTGDAYINLVPTDTPDNIEAFMAYNKYCVDLKEFVDEEYIGYYVPDATLNTSNSWDVRIYDVKTGDCMASKTVKIS